MYCYFCNINACGFTVKAKHKIVYPNFEQARRSILYNDHDLSIPIPPEDGLQMFDEDVFLEENTTAVEDTEVDANFTIEYEDILQKFFRAS